MALAWAPVAVGALVAASSKLVVEFQPPKRFPRPIRSTRKRPAWPKRKVPVFSGSLLTTRGIRGTSR